MSTKKIAQNTIIQLVGKAVSTLLGLVGIGIMTRYLGTEQFGWYVTAISFLQFVGILIDFGMTPVTAQMMSEPTFNKQKLFSNLLSYRFFTSIFFLGIAPIIALFFPYPIIVKQAILLLTISFVSISLNQVFVGYHQHKLSMHFQAISEVIGRIVLVAGLWLVITQQAGFLPVMIVVALASIFYMISMAIFSSKSIKLQLSFDKNIYKAITAKMWPIAISIIFNVVYLRGDVILLSLLSNQNEVGLYGAAYRVIDILGQTAMMIMGVILPLLTFAWSRNNKESFFKQYQQAFDIMMLFALPVTVGTILLAKPIILLVAGPKFIGSVLPLQILSIAVFGVYLGAVFGHTAVAINKQKETMWIYISNAFISLGIYLLLIPKFGMLGAAITTVFSEIYAGTFLYLVMRKHTKHKFNFKTLYKIILSTLIMSGVVSITPNIHVLVIAFIGMIVYGASIIITKAVSFNTIKTVLKR